MKRQKKQPAKARAEPLKVSDRAGVGAQRLRLTVLCLVLATITFAVFGQALRNNFVNYDDPDYVTENRHVQGGLSLRGLAWAFKGSHAGNWHPLTWVSHMLDCQLYGLNPAGHHLSSVLLHAINAVLLFLILARMTETTWRSFLVSALFAWHPAHVESVAWVAERKDVLSIFFALLTIGAYVAYTARLKAGSPGSKSCFLLALLLFALGLMAKPMLVTLPFVLLLLDFWPLRRSRFLPAGASAAVADPRPKRTTALLFEKLPFFILSLVSCVVTIWAQSEGKAIVSLQVLPFDRRLANALVAYLNYLGELVWPSHLAVFYPSPAVNPLWQMALATIILAGVSIVTVRQFGRRPYLLVGWFWFLGTLVPVIGLLQVGVQAMADRYTYFPFVGFFISLVWLAADITAGLRHQRIVLAGAAGAVLLAGLAGTSRQLRYWRDSGTLFSHALEVTRDNYLAHYSLGAFFYQQGRLDEAIAQDQLALQLLPDYVEAMNNLGMVLLKQGKPDEAAVQYKKVLQIQPNFPDALVNLGNLYEEKGDLDEAISCYQNALRIQPGYKDVHGNLASVFFLRGRLEEAGAQLGEALQLEPDNPTWLNNLAWLQATCEQSSLRNGNQAVQLARRADKLAGGNNPIFLRTLAAAFAETGRFDDAGQSVRKAIELARTEGREDMVKKLNGDLQRYQAGLPLHR